MFHLGSQHGRCLQENVAMGSSHILLFSPVSIISPMPATHHYFNIILFTIRGGRRLRKLQKSAPSVIEKCETDILSQCFFFLSVFIGYWDGFFYLRVIPFSPVSVI